MTPTEDKFRQLLNELFRFDRADLDFGIYRVMNLRRDEIRKFIDEDLFPQIQAILGDWCSEERASLERQLEKARQTAQELGVGNVDEMPKVKDLLAKCSSVASVDEQGQRVFDALYEFFRRYYKDGDFIPLPRYKKGVYALPYEGEEVKLSWANQDQYYIKSSDELRNYSFKLLDGRLVHFHVVQAEGDDDNNRSERDKDRRFILATQQPVDVEDGDLVIRFEYQSDTAERTQEEINDATVAAVIANPASREWTALLGAPRQSAETPTLAYHLRQFTARNTYDYFIHKDLGGFLRRELDFYLKNEVLDLDTMEERGVEQALREQLGIARSVRVVGGKIIEFLAQLEDFEKRLWLKKKFVISVNWCVTLDRVPHKLYDAIAKNTAQIEEWERLFAIQDLTDDTSTDPFTEPLSMGFLEHNPYLVVDTRFFDRTFKDTLVSSFSDLDEQTDGVLIHSENFQALELLQARLSHQVDWVFIDPPYNTGNDGFAYKDNYQHSTWLSMILDRIQKARSLMSPSAIFSASIDSVEVSRFRLLLDTIFGGQNFLADVAWEKRYTRSNNAKLFYSLKDTLLTYRASREALPVRDARSESSRANYSNPDNDPRGPWISSSYVNPATRLQRPNLVYEIENPVTGTRVNHPTHAWKYDHDTYEQHVAERRLYWGPRGNLRYPRLKTFQTEASETMVPVDLWHYEDSGTNDEGGATLKSLFGSAVFDNPKPVGLLAKALRIGVPNHPVACVMDFFAGSGTTAHAVISLNREDGRHRKYVLVEMGDHFDTVLKPRIEKVVYSEDWEDGKPVSRKGSSHMFKYMTLESYDDTLANLVMDQIPKGTLFEDADEAREQYVLKYMLRVETRGSQSLLNVAKFDHPFDYCLKVAHGPDTAETTVDLVETFNYLIGLHVCKEDTIRGVRMIQGTSPQGERVLILWRDIHDMDSDGLNGWFSQQSLNAQDGLFDVIYVNGDNRLESLRPADQTWKVRLIEPEFQRLMLVVQDV